MYTSLALSFGSGEFLLYNKPGYNTTFSDWAGPVTGKSVSFGVGTYTWESSTTYNTYGIGLGPGLSIPERGTGAYFKGVTTLIGSPYYAPNPGTD